MEAARYFHSMCHVAIGAMPVVILDQLSMHIGELFDLSKIPWDNSPRNIKILNETMAYYNSYDMRMAIRTSNSETGTLLRKSGPFLINW